MKLNKISYLFLFLFFFIKSCSDKDSSEFLSLIAENKDSIQLKNYLQKTLQFVENNQVDSIPSSVHSLKILSLKTKNNYYIGKSYSILGYLSLIKNQEDSAYFYLNQAKEAFLKINDSVNLAKALTNIAIIQSNQGDYFGSDITAIEALKYLEYYEVDFFSSIYNNLAISSYSQYDHEEAIYWYYKAIESVTDSLNKKVYINNIAVSNRYLEKYNESILILNNLINDSIVIQNADLKSKVIDNLAYSKWKQNLGINVEKEFKEALQIRIENEDKWGQIASHSHLSEYFADKKADSALSHAHKMFDAATAVNSPDDRLEALQKLISLESPENSKKYAVKYTELSDSLVTARSQAKDKFAKIRYDTEKNRKENQLLKIKDVENQVRIQRQQNTTILALSGIGFLTFVLIFVYFQQKNKRKRERLVAAYQSEVRMAKKVHDVVANGLHTFIIRLQNIISSNHPEKENLIAEVENIYQLCRDISHEFQGFNYKKDFNSEIKYLLSSYQSQPRKIIFNLLEDEIWEMVDDLKKVELFRVLQEIMTNMSKHSKADVVLIEFKKEENKIEIVYRDNGIGFSENKPMKKSGITNTENRMENIKGSIIFDSNPGKGLIITITFPI